MLTFNTTSFYESNHKISFMRNHTESISRQNKYIYQYIFSSDQKIYQNQRTVVDKLRQT